MPYSDPERQREYLHRWNVRRKDMVNAKKDNLKSGGCARCGETEMCCLSFHHLDPSVKEYQMSKSSHMMKPGRLESEASKCIVLCENCHRKLHAGLIVL